MHLSESAFSNLSESCWRIVIMWIDLWVSLWIVCGYVAI